MSKPRSGRVHSKVNHFESPGTDTSMSWMDESRNTFGGAAPRFQDTSRVHVGLVDGYTATEVARGLKAGKLVASNATSLSNPLATSSYQVMEHPDSRSAPKDWRRAGGAPQLSTSNATSLDNPLATSAYQVRCPLFSLSTEKEGGVLWLTPGEL